MDVPDAEFYRFLDLLGVVVKDDTDIGLLANDYFNFQQFAHRYPENLFELNFIKWQLSKNTTPASSPASNKKILQAKPVTTIPLKIQKLKKSLNQQSNSEFLNLSFQPVEQTKTTEKIVVDTVLQEKCSDEAIVYNETDTIEAISGLVTYLEQPNIFDQAMVTPPTTPSTPSTHLTRGKNIAVAKQIFEDEQTQQQPPSPLQSRQLTTAPHTTPSLPKRKRKQELEEHPSGRPTKDEVLVRIDSEEDDMCILQLSRRELILPNSKGACKKSKTILTKLKHDITVATQKQFQTYELFAETRRKALDIIRENRDLLEKINSAEFVLTSLLKKQSEN
ncbi:Hypothetical predicted protein [Paramuricea clavata]|uniref:Uncharacterized protein n=1 Tax=Paramuricea clavata TaxID=317549 RepID=A0A7D9IGJ1_PARCT|nr:Hypothetical predicted protein [Paramuricea clavata]